MKVDKNYLKGRIESFIFDKLKKNRYYLIDINPSKLLVWSRLDLAFRTYYLLNKDQNFVYQKEFILNLLEPKQMEVSKSM